MNTSTDDKAGIRSKLENNNESDKLSKALARAASSSSATTTSRQWAGFKNPRIVRVSRTFGGKDRHSKVCTIRGLRDRRIRLSVPTAIQLYDLQDRLGLSQPSKVIDWLLDATKLDIDKLPPLQMPPGNFVDFHQQSLFGQLTNSSSSLVSEAHQFTPYLDANLTLMKEGPSNDNKEGININDDVDLDEDEDEEDQDQDRSIDPNLETMNKWNRKTSSDDQNGASASAQSFFPMAGNNGFLPGLMNGGGLMSPYGNMYHWDPSNLSLSQFGSHGSTSSVAPSHHQTEDPQLSNNYNSSTHQLFFCPPLATTSTLFPQHDNRFHLSNSYGSAMRDFVPHDQQMHSSENNAGHQQDKGDNN